MLCRAALISLAATQLLGCSGEDISDRGAGTGGPCWPIDDATPGGAVVLGGGAAAFQALEDGDALPIEEGIQGGYHITVTARIRALSPGDLEGADGGDAPYSLFSAFDAAGEKISLATCPVRLPYRPIEGDASELVREHRLVLDFQAAIENFDRDVRLRVEVIDARGRYAVDEHLVHALAPPGIDVDAGPGADGGAVDGGTRDAGRRRSPEPRP